MGETVSQTRATAGISPYAGITHLFLELRGRGMSLSSLDLELLSSWRQSNVPPDLIALVMLEVQEECVTRNQAFPSTLIPISRRLQKALKKRQEY